MTHNNNKKIAFYTLGCKVNQYDTQTMINLFENEPGYTITSFNNFADVYIINTCTVTATSDKKSRQMISKAIKQNPNAFVCVAGCFAQTQGETALALEGVKLVIGNKNRSQIVALVEQVLQSGVKINAVEQILAKDDFEELPATTSGNTRAHMKIQEGCNRFCSYCIIPFARGNVRSRALSSVVCEAQRITASGICELVLSGIHLASYKTVNGETLKDVVDALRNVKTLERLRLGSLEPTVITPEFLKSLSNNPQFCNQIHLSLQSGSDEVLRAMNRKYTLAEFEKSVFELRNVFPNIAITTDIIAGFPGESVENHNQTLDFIEKIGFAALHVFPFSKREGTLAATMPNQIDSATKAKRAKEISLVGALLESKYIQSHLQTTQSVLFEEFKDGAFVGYSKNYIKIHVKKDKNDCDSTLPELFLNKVYNVKITNYDSKTNFAIGETV